VPEDKEIDKLLSKVDILTDKKATNSTGRLDVYVKKIGDYCILSKNVDFSSGNKIVVKNKSTIIFQCKDLNFPE
jgi:acetyltransferase-like isoleucine patch superfamily enzyme